MSIIDVTILEKTNDKQLVIKGERKSFPVYKVPLELLQYNVKNGRISTYITEYEDNHDILPSTDEGLNEVLEKYIIDSSPKSFKKTKENIRRFGQMISGVVLSNGVVVDGNRRFSALRQLHREGAGSKFGYLEAIVLDETKYNEKELKTLELNIQHATEEKVNYNSIERLVDIYRDIIGPEAQFSIEEYAAETNESVKDVQEQAEIAKLLVRYLEFLKQPLKFHIARHQKVAENLKEVYKNLKKVDQEDLFDVEQIMFMNIFAYPKDTGRTIRKFKDALADSRLRSQYIEETEDLRDDIEDYFSSEVVQEEVSNYGTISLPEKILKEVAEIGDEIVEKKNINAAQNKPIASISKAEDRIREIDLESVRRMDNSLKSDFIHHVDELMKMLIDIKDEVEC